MQSPTASTRISRFLTTENARVSASLCRARDTLRVIEFNLRLWLAATREHILRSKKDEAFLHSVSGVDWLRDGDERAGAGSNPGSAAGQH